MSVTNWSKVTLSPLSGSWKATRLPASRLRGRKVEKIWSFGKGPSLARILASWVVASSCSPIDPMFRCQLECRLVHGMAVIVVLGWNMTSLGLAWKVNSDYSWTIEARRNFRQPPECWASWSASHPFHACCPLRPSRLVMPGKRAMTIDARWNTRKNQDSRRKLTTGH